MPKSVIFKIIFVITMAVLAGCESSNQLRPISSVQPSVAAEGTLANETLISDTTDSLESFLGSSVITAETLIVKFVIQQPVGNAGVQQWREMWVVDPEGAGLSFIITFKENGMGSADFEIQSM